MTLGPLLSLLPPLQQIRRFQRDPVGTQTRLLRRLLLTAADTEWGRRYGFTALAKEEDVAGAYAARVPLHEFDDVMDDAARIRRGEENVMWPGRIRHFAVSSGTTSSGKVIPVSETMLKLNRRFSLATGLNYLAETGNLRFILGKHLALPGRIEEDPNQPGAFVGEVSGLQAEFAPLFFRLFLQAVPNSLSFLPNWERKLEAIVDHTMEQDIRNVVMAPTWGLVLFKLLVSRYNARHGTHKETVGEIWPNLQTIISGGVPLQSYRDLLEAQVGLPGLHFLETYGASEGFFSFQSSLGDPAMLLHLDNGVFFEFVRQDEYGRPSPRRYTIADVEAGVRYAPFLSTCSGLWSCAVGDVVTFTQTRPHKIIVSGRTGEIIDRYGEAVFGDEAREGLRLACAATGARVSDYHIAPLAASVDRLPTHEWLIEFERPPDSVPAFARVIDEYLQRVNRHYGIRREARAFDEPLIRPLPAGTFYRWLKRARTEISGQTKVPRMSEERAIADSVLAVAGVEK